MLKRILGVLTRIIIGIVLFIFITGFIIIPLGLTWAIPSQGTKILKHPVHLRVVEFNPFILQLTMKGFEILDSHNQVMVSFDKLSVDISFIDLIKKIYHVEDFELDGLKMNVELLPGNQINLLDLVPQNTAQPKVPAPSKASSPTKESKQPTTSTVKVEPLPVVIIDRITLHQGQLHFIDKTVQPNFLTTLSAMELTVTNVTTNPTAQAKVKFKANLDDRGSISMETIIIPLSQPLKMETTFSLNDYALGVLTPYAGKYTGRELRSGKLDLNMEYRISDNMLVASHKVLIQRSEFGNNVESKDALRAHLVWLLPFLKIHRGKLTLLCLYQEI